jgi:hypothetical protein
VQILDTVADLPEHAINLWATHLAGHDHAEEVIWRIFHDLEELEIGIVYQVAVDKSTDLIVMAMVTNNVDRFDDIRVFECRTDAKFCGDFLLVLLLRLARALGPKFLYGKNMTTVFVTGLYKSYCTTCTRAKDAAPLSVLLGNVSLGSL